MTYRPRPVHYEDRSGRGGRWVAGLAFTACLALTYIALSLWQVTGARTAKPALRDALSALVEGDGVVARNYDDLRARADATQPGETLEMRDYPVSVPLTREEVLSSSQSDIRNTLLHRGADVLYERGTDALRGEESSGGAGRFTAAGAIGHVIGFLRDDVHVILAMLTLVLAGISVALAIVVIALSRGFGRAVALSMCATVASLPLLLGGSAAYLYARASTDNDSEYVRRAFAAITRDLATLAVRNGLAFLVAGALLAMVSIVCARAYEVRRR